MSSTQNMAQEKMQKFGRFLSAMVMPNIGAFIAWGFITALFIPTGWIPNEYLAANVGPMVKWLIPLLIGYTGGTIVYGQRGGVVGAITTSGIIIGSEIPMFLGAMIMGPLGAYIIKKFDSMMEDRIPAGFEMLVNNFSAGILGGALALIAYSVVGPIVSSLNDILRNAVEGILALGLIPLISIIVEPAKILFLNNAINHGIFSPIGIQQAQEFGKSIFFLIEANPGPGLGVLLAYALFAKGSAKSSAPSAIVIHFFGGIHEIYFPYVLMKPILLLAVIPAGMAGVFTLSVLNGGLIAPASPGSIFAVLAMTPKGAFLANILAVLVATLVSFAIASILLKTTKQVDDLDKAKEDMQKLKNRSDKLELNAIKGHELNYIVYACDAGMGSSAMGASALKNKLHKAGYKHIKVKNFAIENIPSDAQLVVSHVKLRERALKHSLGAEHIFVEDFINNNVFEEIIKLLAEKPEVSPLVKNNDEKVEKVVSNKVLLPENIFLNEKAANREEAIKLLGRKLVEAGYVQEEYIAGMLNREEKVSTYIGKGFAIPHGEDKAKQYVTKTGLVVVQFPNGIDFNGEKAYILVGIAANGDEHIEILANLAVVISETEDKDIEELYTTENTEKILKIFSK